MKLVKTLDQILSNIAELECDREEGGDALEKYRSLVKLGICFFPYESQERFAFAPSRFIGYLDNRLATHADNPDRDGGETNKAINRVLGVKPTENAVLEEAYREFCVAIGVTHSERCRKYWKTPDVRELFEKRAQIDITRDPNLSNTEKQQLVKARVGQGAFRESLIRMWGRCGITGCGYVDILRSSHIKPWRDATNEERLDTFNGLLLSPNIDALFDRGLISFTDHGELLISSRLSDSARKALGCPSIGKVPLQQKHAKYMAWHRQHVFCDTQA